MWCRGKEAEKGFLVQIMRFSIFSTSGDGARNADTVADGERLIACTTILT